MSVLCDAKSRSGATYENKRRDGTVAFDSPPFQRPSFLPGEGSKDPRKFLIRDFGLSVIAAALSATNERGRRKRDRFDDSPTANGDTRPTNTVKRRKMKTIDFDRCLNILVSLQRSNGTSMTNGIEIGICCSNKLRSDFLLHH